MPFIVSGLGITSKKASWHRETGTLVVPVIASDFILIPAFTYVSMSFQIVNQNRPQLSPVKSTDYLWLTLNSTDGLHDVEGHSSLMTQPSSIDEQALRVRPVQVTSASLAQSSTYPCVDNTITVKFTLDGILAYACADTITLQGLTGSVTFESQVTFESAATSDAFSLLGKWQRVSGTMVLTLAKNLLKDTEYSVAFKLKNPSFQQSASDVFWTEPFIVNNTRRLTGNAVCLECMYVFVCGCLETFC